MPVKTDKERRLARVTMHRKSAALTNVIDRHQPWLLGGGERCRSCNEDEESALWPCDELISIARDLGVEPEDLRQETRKLPDFPDGESNWTPTTAVTTYEPVDMTNCSEAIYETE